MSEVVKRKNTEPADQAADLFEGYGNAATARSIEGMLLRFSKGDYLAGQDSEEVPLGTRFTAVMDSLSVGWVCWQANAPIEQRMGLVVEGFQPARRNDLGDHDKASWERDNDGEPRDPWQFTNYLILHKVDGGEVFTFTTSSKGGLGAIGELAKAYGKTMRQRPGQYPVIELDVGSYQHRDRSLGRIKYPVFKIVDWMAKDSGNSSPATPPKSLPPDKTSAAAPKSTAKPSTQPQF
jgi:hypothetical protein